MAPRNARHSVARNTFAAIAHLRSLLTQSWARPLALASMRAHSNTITPRLHRSIPIAAPAKLASGTIGIMRYSPSATPARKNAYGRCGDSRARATNHAKPSSLVASAGRPLRKVRQVLGAVEATARGASAPGTSRTRAASARSQLRQQRCVLCWKRPSTGLAQERSRRANMPDGNSSFEASLVVRRQHILDSVARAAQGALGRDWPGRLLSALASNACSLPTIGARKADAARGAPSAPRLQRRRE